MTAFYIRNCGFMQNFGFVGSCSASLVSVWSLGGGRFSFVWSLGGCLFSMNVSFFHLEVLPVRHFSVFARVFSAMNGSLFRAKIGTVSVKNRHTFVPKISEIATGTRFLTSISEKKQKDGRRNS